MRRRLRLVAVAVLLGLLAGAIGLLGARSLTPEAARRILGQAGFWVPLGLLSLSLGGLLILRRRFGRTHLRLEADRIQAGPGWLRRLVSGVPGRSLGVGEVQRIGALSLGRGNLLVLTGPGVSGLMIPLEHPAACHVVSALLERAPREAWEEEARALATALSGARAGGPVAATGPTSGGAQPGDEALRAAGLWHLAAARAWPDVLARPTDAEAARALYRLERHRLPSAPRLRLALALAVLHPGEALYRFEVARLALVLRLKELALEALGDLVSRPDAPSLAGEWRRRLRERRALPAPGSRATFGIEIGLPEHRLDGDHLVVNDRFRVGLDWFVAYRLVPGFWGPPRAFELVDLWGERHLVRGEPLAWAESLRVGAPHLCEVHEEGWLWPPPGPRLRALERAGQGQEPRADPPQNLQENSVFTEKH